MSDPDPRNKLNELSGSQWLYFTKSLLTTSYPREFSHDLRKAHGANKPPRLMQQLIEFFTKPGELVLDPFAGVGGTLLGASICTEPRRCLGIEINGKWKAVYKQVLEENPEVAPQELLVGDCSQLLPTLPDNHFHFIATDPPYNTHLERTMCDGRYEEDYPNRRTDYDMASPHGEDLANLSSYDEFLDTIEGILQECLRVLIPGRYMAVILRNAYQKGRYIFTHADVANRATRAGFRVKGEVVWHQTGSRLRPYGYPYAYVPNIVHQFILIIRKPLK